MNLSDNKMFVFLIIMIISLISTTAWKIILHSRLSNLEYNKNGNWTKPTGSKYDELKTSVKTWTTVVSTLNWIFIAMIFGLIFKYILGLLKSSNIVSNDIELTNAAKIETKLNLKTKHPTFGTGLYDGGHFYDEHGNDLNNPETKLNADERGTTRIKRRSKTRHPTSIWVKGNDLNNPEATRVHPEGYDLDYMDSWREPHRRGYIDPRGRRTTDDWNE